MEGMTPKSLLIVIAGLLGAGGVRSDVTAPEPAAAPARPAAPAATPTGARTIALPGAQGGVMLDYLTVDRERHRVWVPAGGTGRVDVIDTRTKEVHAIEGFPTAEVERGGRKRMIGPSSVTIGDGAVYIGNRADSSVCAIDAVTFKRLGCMTLASMPDGVVFLRRARQVWVTTPRDRAITILDVSRPGEPKLSDRIELSGRPEGYAVDEEHGAFFTNLEDLRRTLRIDVSTGKVTASWTPGCGEDGPRGLALASSDRKLLVACTDDVAVLDTTSGAILSRLPVGAGLDNIDYLPSRRELYAAAGDAERLTIARLEEKGSLTRIASISTAPGARNAVAAEDGTAYIADGRAGRILVVEPDRR